MIFRATLLRSLFDALRKQHHVDHIPGDYCAGVPPLSIPNREVKPCTADGPALIVGEKVVARLPSKALLPNSSRPFFMSQNGAVSPARVLLGIPEVLTVTATLTRGLGLF